MSLAVSAPSGPPADAADFLARLDAGWLATAYGDGQPRRRAGPDRAPGARRRTWRCGSARCSGGSALAWTGLAASRDADVWYCILEGTAEIAVAEAQARPLVDLLASYVVPTAAAAPGRRRRRGRRRPEVLLAVDEFSAVSRRLPVWQLYERARSLGLAVQVSAQSWQGLAADEDERYRIAASADGGIWLLRTPHPDPVVALAGNRSVHRHHPAAARRPAVERRGFLPGPAHPGARPGHRPLARRRPGRLRVPRRSDLRPGEAAGGGAGRAAAGPPAAGGAAAHGGRARPARARDSRGARPAGRAGARRRPRSAVARTPGRCSTRRSGEDSR